MRIVNKEQLDLFIVLFRSDIDRMNEMLEHEENMTLPDRRDLVLERDKFVLMCENLGGESA